MEVLNRIIDNFAIMRGNREENKDLIFGVHSVIEAIRSGRPINKIMIQKGMNRELFFELKEELAGKDYYLQFVPNEKLNRLTPKNHQGVIALASPIEYQKIEDILQGIFEAGEQPNILVLDRITDVRNFGAIARTAECSGVHAILLPSRGSVTVTSDAVKTSAGALNKIPVCMTDDMGATLDFLRESGLRLIGCTEKTDKYTFDITLSGPTAIIMGSEEDGISPEFLAKCQQKAKIPLLGTIGSYNVGVATGVILYEKLRQEILE